MTAKTKVAPVRATTIPRLELCGAVLATKLTVRCIQTLAIDGVPLFAWCDSKIVLAWLATHASKWNTFVANRVSEIQHGIDPSHWRYIKSKQNPADIASRGASVNDLKTSTMWWHGPSFLSDTSEPTPNQNFNLPVDTAPEKKKTIKTFHTVVPKQNYILQYFTKLSKLLHFTCLVVRWMNRTKKKPVASGPINAMEIEFAETHWIKLIQREHFGH